MADAPLNPEELEAIQDAIREAKSGPDRPSATDTEAVVPLALIADDRAAEHARPAGMRIAERWAVAATRRLKHLAGDLTLSVVGAETVDGAGIREELTEAWLCAASPCDRDGAALIAVGGEMIEALAARILGEVPREVDEDDDDDEDEDEESDEEADTSQSRPPSPTAIRLFGAAGQAILEGLVTAWSDTQGCEIAVEDGAEIVDEIRRNFIDADVLTAITISVEGETTGRIRLFARPLTFVAPPAPVEAIPATQAAIDEALGEVPVEIIVEFGRAQLTMHEVSELRVGAVLRLPKFIDTALPIECAGVVKAYGRPVVYRGVIAVEIDPNAGRKAA